MLKSLKSNSYRFVVVLLLLLTFLTTGMVGKVIPSYALAQPVQPELAPIFDTQIYQFQEYCQEHLSESQYNILYLLLGAWVCSQAGMNEYSLVDPYTTDDGVRGWLKSTGITIYNQMLNLAGGRIYDPVTGTDLTPLLSSLAGYALGAAAKASTYENESDFINDVETSEHYFVPYDPVLQASINAYFGRKDGLWNWQFDVQPFNTNRHYFEGYYSPAIKAQYEQDFAPYPEPHVRINFSSSGSSYNCLMADDTFFVEYCNLFVNTDTHKIYFAKNDGTLFNQQTFQPDIAEYIQDNQIYSYWSSYVNFNNGWTYNTTTYPTVVSAVNAFFDNVWISNLTYVIFYSDFIEHVYAGTNWATKQEIFNLTDLNFAENNSPSYNQVPDDTLLDIKGLLVDILDNTDLFQIVVDNLFKPDGTLNIDLPDIKVSIKLPDDNPLPVNLNDIQIYTDNEYLDVVKQRALQASETIGEYVAFWHNCDSELVYAILGSFIVILIGAFIGKWGHS